MHRAEVETVGCLDGGNVPGHMARPALRPAASGATWRRAQDSLITVINLRDSPAGRPCYAGLGRSEVVYSLRSAHPAHILVFSPNFLARTEGGAAR